MINFIIIISTIKYILIKTKLQMKILQQNFYNENNRYWRWGCKNLNHVFNGADIIIYVINFINLFIKSKLLLFLNLFYLLICFLYNNEIKKDQNKIPLKVTFRVKRLFVTHLLIYLFVSILTYKNIYLFNMVYSLLIVLNFYLLLLSNILNYPIDKIIYIYFYIKTRKKIKELNNLEIIGITGSYGKTSSKNILNDILKIKYNSVTTPYNYNTKYGIMITLNNYINKFNDIFVAEMGAFKVGSIKTLCNMIKPKYGIITNIGMAHLETFKSKDNILKAKFELIDSLPDDGLAILNADDNNQKKYEIKSNCEKKWIAIRDKDADIIARDIIINSEGMNFKVYFKEDNKEYRFTTSLLGEANVYNLLAAIAFGKYKGMTIKELQYGVKILKQTSHRLEIKRFDNKVIIDDSYNSNPIGSKMALDVLNLMDGFKIVVTPGMIELGEEEYELNKKFGEQISEVADYVILVGKNRTKSIYDGLMKNNDMKFKVIIINDLKDAFKIIDNLKTKKKKYILLENDLPDIFNEYNEGGI